MKFDLDDVFNSFLHMTFRQKVNRARKSIAEMSDFLIANDIGDEDRISFYLNLARLFIGADGKVSLAECELFNELFYLHLTYPDFSKLMTGNDKEFISVMDQAIDLMDKKAKVAACEFGLAFLSVDQELSEKEKAVFEKILQ